MSKEISEKNRNVNKKKIKTTNFKKCLKKFLNFKASV